MATIQSLLNQCKSELSHLEPGEKFIVKDLFMGYIWKRIPKNDRIRVGSSFYTMVKETDLGVKTLGKTTANQQEYQKI